MYNIICVWRYSEICDDIYMTYVILHNNVYCAMTAV